MQWEWNWCFPDCEMEKERRFAGGKLELALNVVDGLIQDLSIFGDFGRRDGGTERALNGRQYREEAVAQVLDGLEFEEYFVGIRTEFRACLTDLSIERKASQV